VFGCKPLIVGVLTAFCAFGSTNAVDPVIRAEQAYLQARIRYEQERTDLQSAWQFGQACFELADVVGSNSRRAKIANEGIDACKLALERDPKLATAEYYLALNLGQLARTKSIGALRLVSQMEAALKQTIKLDPEVDFAGPHRSLGLLYRDAPGFPTSVGSRSKARLHLQKAVELRPDFPENWLCLLETYLKWGDKRAAESQLKKVDELLTSARAKYRGETWAASWQDWEHRWTALLKEVSPQQEHLTG
jgi:tetratricopeptide (TPR) repeat protein